MQMLESTGFQPGVGSPCGEESGEEELTVLPRHTKVVVTGNNRTKSVLVGLRGVVKKAVGLGGWHWLVLTNGEEVKLQRNALSVIEPPTGHEDNEENGCENMMSSSSELVSDDFQKSHKPKLQHHKLVVPVPKGATRNHSSDSQSTESKSSSHGMLTVDLSKLDPAALWRYWRHFNLADVSLNSSKEQLVNAVEKHFISEADVSLNSSKEQLVNAVEKHFISEQLDELQVIAGFVQAAKRLKRVCA